MKNTDVSEESVAELLFCFTSFEWADRTPYLLILDIRGLREIHTFPNKELTAHAGCELLIFYHFLPFWPDERDA